MMKITSVSALLFERPLDGKAWNPAFRWNERRAPLVVLEDEDGIAGIGEGWSTYTDVHPVLDALATEMAPAILGRRLAHPSEMFDAWKGKSLAWHQAAALSAIDMALWDLHARRMRQPLWQCLGGTSPSCPVYVSGGLYRDDNTLQDLSDEFASYKARGFTAFKIKVGGVEQAADMARIAVVRRAIGDNATLWIDAVNQFTQESAFACWDKARPYRITGLQSPLPASDIQGMRRLVQQGIPVIASAEEYRRDAFLHLLEEQAVTILQFCLTLCGGFSGGLALDLAARQFGRPSSPQCFSTSIAQAAAYHFAAARGNVVSAECHGFHDHLAYLYPPDMGDVKDGRMSLGYAPGLGVRLPSIGEHADGSRISLYHTRS